MKHDDKLIALAIKLDIINEKIRFREEMYWNHSKELEDPNTSNERRLEIIKMLPTDEMRNQKTNLELAINKELNRHDLNWFLKNFCKTE